ncbi:hypothetical protein BGW36DRAFT_304893 [Talaromyces proteolyticus]|uniref:Zn(2)-C6 fungal-type domain-containing protein n=1 Tax=Talaromyces proteolyticus TaxID=1131652 RepID=A0AAD4KJD7_9EURO|nr:uncharacterized protein BGW36DRAFT_304893 [Talaromyces proteolyticus]KAH8691623.1 hypothetical protein BGW36DRAFT_304893 [Talaromyces proteolyticus]
MPRARQRTGTSEATGQRSRRIACRNCRQAKMRCELSAGGPVPCHRCRRLDRECKVDTEYKRINRQEKLEELEEEIRQLRSSIKTTTSSDSRTVENNPPVNGMLSSQFPTMLSPGVSVLSNEILPAVPAISFEESPGSSSRRLSQFPGSSSSRSIGHIRLESSQIDAYFHLFFEKYFPHLPFLDPFVSPDEYYLRSPLLFWMIVYVSSRRVPDEPGLGVSLIPPVKKLLWESISSPPHSWELVQSIILVCMWPFPTSSLSTDNSIVLVTTAQTIAMRLGLHRPDAIQDFSRTNRRLSKSEVSEALRTWSACFIAAQSLAVTDGQPLMASDLMIDRLCDQETTDIIPEALRFQLVVARFAARVCSVMSGTSKFTTDVPRLGESLSVLALLEQEFMDMSSSIANNLTVEDRILLDGTGLHLYVFFLIEPGGSDIRRRALLRAFHMATTLIAQLHGLDKEHGMIEFGPLSHFRTVSLSAMFILKIGHSSYAEYLDCERGKHLFHVATQLMRRMSIEDNDLPGRMSKIMTQLWSAQARIDKTNEEPSLKLRTRLSGSLLHDSLWSWRETFGGQAGDVDRQNGLAGI